MAGYGEALLGGALSIAGGLANNSMAAWRENTARADNYYYGELAAGNADKRTRKLYEDLQSPEAMMRQLKAAGLSPSLMYGNGTGGTVGQGAQGTGAAGISPTTYGIDPLSAAQIGLINAQTKKTNVETDTINPIANATVSSMLADAGYKNAAASAARAQTTGIELDNYVKENTKDANIFKICELADKAGYEAQKTYYEMKDAKLLNDFNQETFNDRINIVKEQMNQLVQSIAESKSLQHLNEVQRQFVKVSMLDIIDTANREWAKYNLSAEQFETFLEKQIPIMQGELEAKLKDLDIKKKRLVIDAITDTFKSLAMGAMAASSMGLGNGSNATPSNAKDVLVPKRGGNATHKGAPIYKTSNVWGF